MAISAKISKTLPRPQFLSPVGSQIHEYREYVIGWTEALKGRCGLSGYLGLDRLCLPREAEDSSLLHPDRGVGGCLYLAELMLSLLVTANLRDSKAVDSRRSSAGLEEEPWPCLC